MKVSLMMTYGVSLRSWAADGLLDREVRLYRALVARGVDVQILTWGGADDLNVLDDAQIEVTPIYSIVRPWSSKYLRLIQSFLIPFSLRKRIAGARLLKTNQMWGSWVAIILGLAARKPVLLRSGYELYDFERRQSDSRLFVAFVWLISHFAYRFANRIHVATKTDAVTATERFGIRSDKVHVFPNWIDFDRFAPAETRESKNVLAVGRLTSQKNLSLLIEALSDTDIGLDLVGEGELRQELEAQAFRLGVTVNFLGRLPNEKLAAVYAAHPVFVICSTFEGNPKVLLEAMASGCAVIGTDAPGIREIIRHNETGIISAQTAPALRKSIMELVRHQDAAQSLGIAARNAIRETNDFDVLVERELRAYVEIS